MPDTARTLSAMQTLLADNSVGAISPQDLRDLMQSVATPVPGGGFGFGWTEVFKQSDEVVSNSATLQNDDELLLAVSANTDYWFECYIRQISDSSDCGFRWKFTVPAGANLNWSEPGAGTIEFDANTVDTISVTANERQSVFCYGQLHVGGTAGDLRLQWAQEIATPATNTTVEAKAWIRHRVLDT